MRDSDELLVAFELHSPDRIRAVLDGGLDVRAPIRGKSPVEWLTEMYSRSDRFPTCLQLLLERGAQLDDDVMAPVLLNDAGALVAAIRRNPSLIDHRTSLVSAFTPLDGASLLHVAAEYGNTDVAQVLVDIGRSGSCGCSWTRAPRVMYTFGGSLGGVVSNGRRPFSMSRRSHTRSSVFFFKCIAPSATPTTT
jgi:hypothetical protein